MQINTYFFVTPVTKAGLGETVPVISPGQGEAAVVAVRNQFGPCRLVLVGFNIDGTVVPAELRK